MTCFHFTNDWYLSIHFERALSGCSSGVCMFSGARVNLHMNWTDEDDHYVKSFNFYQNLLLWFNKMERLQQDYGRTI